MSTKPDDQDDDLRALVRSAAMSIHVQDRQQDIMARSARRRRPHAWRTPLAVAAAIGAVLLAVAVVRTAAPHEAPVAATTTPIPTPASAATLSVEATATELRTINDCDPAAAPHQQIPDAGEGLPFYPGTLTAQQFGTTSLVCWYRPKSTTPHAALAADITRPIAAFDAPPVTGGGHELWGVVSTDVTRLRLVCVDLNVNFTPDGGGSTGRLLNLGPAIGFVSPMAIGGVKHATIELTAYNAKGAQIDSRKFTF